MTTATDTTPVRVYLREGRNPGGKIVQLARVHVGCSCYLRNPAMTRAFGTIGEARTAHPHAELCKKSRSITAPQHEADAPAPAPADAATTGAGAETVLDAAPVAAEGVTAQADADAAEATPAPVEAEAEPEAAEVVAVPPRTELAARAAQPGLAGEHVRTLLTEAFVSILHVPATGGLETTAYEVTHKDSAGIVRHEMIERIVRALGGACDVVGNWNENRSGRTSFTVNVYAPASTLAAINQVMPVAIDRAQMVMALAARRHRQSLNEQEGDRRAIDRALKAFRERFTAQFLGAMADAVTAAAAEAGITVDCAKARAAAALAQAERQRDVSLARAERKIAELRAAAEA